MRRAIVWACVACVAVLRADASTEDISKQFASALAKIAATTASGNALKIGGHSLSLHADIEQVAQARDGKFAAGVKVRCSIDGAVVVALTSGSVGVDATRDAALATAAEEWAMEFGAPIAEALASKPAALHSGGFAIYAGPVGIRGEKPQGMADVTANLFHAIEPALAPLAATKGFHAITITAVREKDGSIDGEFRLDGRVSDELKRRAQQAKWPTSASAYMLKQFYVLVRERR